jgi:chromatin modification-related protein EAF6
MSIAMPQSLPTLKKRKAQLEEDLRLIEAQIYELETAYVDETNVYGNIIKGWAEFATIRLRQPPNQRKIRAISTRERIFSSSSTTAPVNRVRFFVFF